MIFSEVIIVVNGFWALIMCQAHHLIISSLQLYDIQYSIIIPILQLKEKSNN